MADLAHDMLAMLRRLRWVYMGQKWDRGHMLDAWHCPCCGCYSYNRASEHHRDSGCELDVMIRRAEADGVSGRALPDPPRWERHAFSRESATIDGLTACVRPDYDPWDTAEWGGRWKARLSRHGDGAVIWEGRDYPDAVAAKAAAEKEAGRLTGTLPPDPLRLWRAEFPGHIATGSALIVAADEPDALAMLAGRMRAAGLDPASARLCERPGRRVPGVAMFDDGGA